MATFKVGQRVKNIYNGWDRNSNIPLGVEGIVASVQPPDCVHKPGYGIVFDHSPIEWMCRGDTLAPLTDPGADAFIERIKKLKPEPVAPELPVRVTAN